METSPSMGMAGVGAYSMLLGMEPSTPGVWTQQYVVRMKAAFFPLLVGHPKMALHKQWARVLLDGLQDAFDEQLIWQRTVENYMLRQHLPPASSRERMPFGPLRFTPATP